MKRLSVFYTHFDQAKSPKALKTLWILIIRVSVLYFVYSIPVELLKKNKRKRAASTTSNPYNTVSVEKENYNT